MLQPRLQNQATSSHPASLHFPRHRQFLYHLLIFSLNPSISGSSQKGGIALKNLHSNLGHWPFSAHCPHLSIMWGQPIACLLMAALFQTIDAPLGCYWPYCPKWCWLWSERPSTAMKVAYEEYRPCGEQSLKLQCTISTTIYPSPNANLNPQYSSLTTWMEKAFHLPTPLLQLLSHKVCKPRDGNYFSLYI